MKNKEFLEQVLDGLKISGVKIGSKVIVAFSGGPDSTALLLSLTNLQERFPLTIIGGAKKKRRNLVIQEFAKIVLLSK